MQRKEEVEMHLLTTNFLGIYQKFWVEGLRLVRKAQESENGNLKVSAYSSDHCEIRLEQGSGNSLFS